MRKSEATLLLSALTVDTCANKVTVAGCKMDRKRLAWEGGGSAGLSWWRAEHRHTEYVINRRLFASIDESLLLCVSDDPIMRPLR